MICHPAPIHDELEGVRARQHIPCDLQPLRLGVLLQVQQCVPPNIQPGHLQIHTPLQTCLFCDGTGWLGPHEVLPQVNQHCCTQHSFQFRTPCLPMLCVQTLQPQQHIASVCMRTWNVCAAPLRRMPTVSWQGLLSVSRSAVAARMASTRGLQRRLEVSASRASGSCQPLSQYMYASAVAGARPRPATQQQDEQGAGQ